jgi:type IV secretion system protein VirB1
MSKIWAGETMLDFLILSQSCAPSVHPDTMYRLFRVESSFNPYAIGVVGAHLAQQPRTGDEAIGIARWLRSHGYNYSVGLAQISVKNFATWQSTPGWNIGTPIPVIRYNASVCFARFSRHWLSSMVCQSRCCSIS